MLEPEIYRHYIDTFNACDNELYKEYFTNKNSWEFLSANIPFFDCPDKILEQTYISDGGLTGKDSLCKELLQDMVANYNAWEKEKLDTCGLF